MNKHYELMCMIISEGSIEILQFLAKKDVGYFKELRKLRNMRTNKFFSSTTISLRLKELIKLGAIVKVISDVDGRNVVAYKIAPPGIRTLELADKFEDELGKVLKK